MYDDIIDLPHYEPRRHPRMSMMARAAQFSSFAALTGYEDAIDATASQHQNNCETDTHTSPIDD